MDIPMLTFIDQLQSLVGQLGCSEINVRVFSDQIEPFIIIQARKGNRGFEKRYYRKFVEKFADSTVLLDWYRKEAEAHLNASIDKTG